MNVHRFGKFPLVLILFLVTTVAVYILFAAGERLGLRQTQAPEGGPYFIESVAMAADEIAAMEDGITYSRNNAIVQAAKRVGPSVVSISTIQVRIVRDPRYDFFFPYSPGMKRKSYGLGSGFIIDKRGYVLTNHHVIEDADEIKVALSNGTEFEAKVIGADYESDLAVLKIESKSDLPVVELGDSFDLMVGEWAIAIGNPFGFLIRESEPSVSLGVVSATGRSLQDDKRTFEHLIQTDATINPGNSGGPLVNSHGQVIGISTAIFSTSGGSQGVGFAIPINIAKRVINDLIKYGMVTEPWVGIEYQQLDKDIAEHLGSPTSEGIFISNVLKDSPAQKAGLLRGDIVVKVGKRKVRTRDGATAAIESLESGQEITFRIVRDGEFQDVLLKVGSTEAVETARTWFGLVVQKPTPGTAIKYGLSSYERGVLVIQVRKKSPADKGELKRGDLIINMSREQAGVFRSFEDMKINTLDDFRKFVSSIRSGQRIRIIFERKGELWRTYLAATKQ